MGTMTNDETYNGYANRETWAFNLHWQNDQGLYYETLNMARAAALLAAQVDPAHAVSARELGEAVVLYWKETIESIEEDADDSLPDALRMMDREVGSWWRIDYAEVGAAVRESLEAEGD